MKDASAIHSLPRIIIRKVYSRQEYLNGTGAIDVTISNPKDVAVDILIEAVDRSGTPTSGSLYNLSDAYTRKPPVSNSLIQFELRGSAPLIQLGAYEDELLRADDAPASLATEPKLYTSTGTGSEINHWAIAIDHNVANVKVPVSFSISSDDHSQLNSLPEIDIVAELSLLVTTVEKLSNSGEGGSGPELKFYTKIYIIIKPDN